MENPERSGFLESVYYYIYDTFLGQRKYRDALARLETRTTDLGIQGKIGRLTMLKNLRELIAEGIRKGAKTIVICGNDDTVLRAITPIIDAGVTLGIVPFGGPNTIASALGIVDEVHAAEILSERLAKRLDVGVVNEDTYFLRECAGTFPAVSIECNERYHVTPLARTLDLVVANLSSPLYTAARTPNPLDGMLDVVITHNSFFRRKQAETHIPLTHLTIPIPEPRPLTLDGWNTVMTPATIEVLPQMLRVIVGKGRTF